MKKQAIKKNDIQEVAFVGVNTILLILFAVSIIIPFLSLLSISLTTAEESARLGIRIIPREFSFSAYAKVFENRFIWTGYKNTLLRVVLGTTLNIIATCIAAYPLSKRYLPGRKYFTLYFIVNMFFTGGMIPTYLLIRSLNLNNTIWVLILPTLVGTYTMLVVRSSFMTIPDSVEESAKIDGANDIIILFRIVIPMSAPIIFTIGLWYAVAHWNNWFDCLLYVTQEKRKVLQIVLRDIILTGKDDTTNTYDLEAAVSPESIKAASIYVSTIPILCIYPFIQKYFVKGITLGSVKG